MSPEQAFGESVDQRSDLFSLGTVLYETLTGRQPFEGDNYMGVIQNIIHQNAPRPSRLGIDLPPGVEAILVKSMHKNRDSRFQSAREFRRAIEKHMGLDALNEATESLKSLLVADGATMLLPKTERARTQKRRLKRAITVAFVVAGVAGLAAIGYYFTPNTAMKGRIAEVLARSDKTSRDAGAVGGERTVFRGNDGRPRAGGLPFRRGRTAGAAVESEDRGGLALRRERSDGGFEARHEVKRLHGGRALFPKVRRPRRSPASLGRRKAPTSPRDDGEVRRPRPPNRVQRRRRAGCRSRRSLSPRSTSTAPTSATHPGASSSS